MSDKAKLERMFFTFRGNGNVNDQDLAEATVQKLDEHEPPAGSASERQSWFGAIDKLGTMLTGLGFDTLDIDGVLSTLKVNKVATREMSVTADALKEASFKSI